MIDCSAPTSVAASSPVFPIPAGTTDCHVHIFDPVVLHRLAGAQARHVVEHPGFASLCRLISYGKAWVKLSPPYCASPRGADLSDVAPIARTLIETKPHRFVDATADVMTIKSATDES